MLNRLFPKTIDNTYRGHWLGLWLIVPVVLIRLAQGVSAMVAPRFIAAGADAIPLDRYDPAAAATMVGLFALLGLSISLILLWGVVVLIRYRAMVPLLYLIVLLQLVGTKVLLLLHPIARAGTSGSQTASLIVWSIFGATVIGFLLSLMDRTRPSEGAR